MTPDPSQTGILFVISAPSGTGKSTLAGRLLAADPALSFSVSYTTRGPRSGERDGREYHFVDRARFEAMQGEGAFLESAEVHGELYGTGLTITRELLGQGCDVLLDIDVQGAGQVRRGPVPGVAIMILPPDYETLETRLRNRASESEAVRDRRLAQASREVRDFEKFDYMVVNDDLERAVRELKAIVLAERRRTQRLREQADRIISTFPDPTH